MLISWKPPDSIGTIATVLTVPPCKLSVAALPAMTISWSFKIVNALGPLATVLNVVGEPTAMSIAVIVPPAPMPSHAKGTTGIVGLFVKPN